MASQERASEAMYWWEWLSGATYSVGAVCNHPTGRMGLRGWIGKLRVWILLVGRV